MDIRAGTLRSRERVAAAGIAVIAAAALVFIALPRIAEADTAQTAIYSITALFAEWASQSQVDKCAGILLGTDSGYLEAALSAGDNIYAALEVFGVLLIIIYSAYELYCEMLRDEPTMDMWLRIFTRAVIGIMVISSVTSISGEGMRLVNVIDGLGQAVVEYVADNVNSPAAQETLVGLFEEIDTEELGLTGLLSLVTVTGFYSIQAIISMVIPYAILQIDSWIIRIMSYALFFELMLRHSLFPIAAALIATKEFSRNALRYMKRYIAVYLKMCVLLVIVALQYALIYQVILNGYQASIEMLGSDSIDSLAALFMTYASGQLQASQAAVAAIPISICLVIAGKKLMHQSMRLVDDMLG